MRTNKIIALAFVVLLATPALFAQGHSGGCSCGKRSPAPVQWEIEHSFDGHPDYVNAAKAEFDRWNNVASLFTYVTGDGTVGIPDGKNEIMFLNSSDANSFYGLSFDSGLFGITPISPESAFGSPQFNACPKPSGTSCGTISEADVIINSDFARGFTPNGPPDFDDNTGPAYYGATALHELGHSTGLHHNFNNLSTMNYYQDYAAQYLAIADAQAIRSNYSSNTKTMTDMATYPFLVDTTQTEYQMPQVATLSTTSAAPGGKFDLRNVTVENVGTGDLNDVKLEVYLSTDSTITTGDIYCGRLGFNNPFFASGFFDGDLTGITVPANTPAGTYYVGVRVTYNTTSTDTITYNNTWVGPQKLTVTGTGGGTCTPGTNNLCLNSSRFKVQLNATDPRTGNTGVGVATPFNNIVGYFSIPALTGDPTNFEVFVKVLDGRPINGKFWVFYGGLTDFAYTLTVTDVTTGAVKTYTKAGGSYTGNGDTNAFTP